MVSSDLVNRKIQYLKHSSHPLISLVELPPIPKSIESAPNLLDSQSNSPTPNEDVSHGSLFSTGKSASPTIEDISTIANFLEADKFMKSSMEESNCSPDTINFYFLNFPNESFAWWNEKFHPLAFVNISTKPSPPSVNGAILVLSTPNSE